MTLYLILTTTDNETTAEKIVKGLLEKKLAGCIWRLRIQSDYL